MLSLCLPVCQWIDWRPRVKKQNINSIIMRERIITIKGVRDLKIGDLDSNSSLRSEKNLTAIPRRYRHNLALKFVLDNETKFWCDCHPLRDNLGTSINQLLSFCQRNFVILCQDSRAVRTVVSGYSVLACKREYFPLHPSQVPCTCPLLTLSSLSSTLFHSWMLDEDTSHLIGYQSPSLWCDWPVAAPRSCMIQLTDHWCASVRSVTMCVMCQSIVRCPVYIPPRPCHYRGRG